MQSEETAVEFPNHFEESVQTTPEEFKQQIHIMAALKMFELGKLSSGKAAELAGQSRAEFFTTCARYKVSAFNYPDDETAREIQQDFESARQLHLR
jgi:predicted HTH domain antitoxin